MKEEKSKKIPIPDDWYNLLEPIITSDYFADLSKFIRDRRNKVNVFPKSQDVFRAFNLTPLSEVRVVILGMDPYPNLYKGEPVACGLAFAPSNREYIPPSLKMIYKNIKERIYPNDFKPKEDLNLESWAKQGVFLINAALTVEEGKAGSHLYQWHQFTNRLLTSLSQNTNGIIFCFWGKDAQKFSQLVNHNNHYVLNSSHPVSAVYKGGEWDCDHFEQINKILHQNNKEKIEWI